MERCIEDRDKLFSVVSRGKTKGNKHKLKHKKFHVNFLTVSVTKHRHSFCRKIVELEIFSAGDIQRHSGHGPGQPGLDSTA